MICETKFDRGLQTSVPIRNLVMTRYLVDTSSLGAIEELPVGADRKAVIWSGVTELFRAGKLSTVDIVLDEVDRNKEDPVFAACKAHTKEWRRATHVFRCSEISGHLAYQFFAQVISEYPSLSGVNKIRRRDKADPYLIAVARWDGSTVVTEESKTHSTRIPAACLHYMVDCLNLEELIRAENL